MATLETLDSLCIALPRGGEHKDDLRELLQEVGQRQTIRQMKNRRRSRKVVEINRNTDGMIILNH